ncbi:alginate lyase family protein [Hymenobacter sp. M29]|uniref:Alginate lyase family protein n=1 Tax=Hymenobacter mellowenesis TaxID=3063995 RepID=A0ABT9A8T9_9BACT|nr:alginate lyase family protein [Hymenobacter sp. M29]MDO7846253.1 alginate lyase family protein [Hymenobacter sp. M29]
MSNLLNTSALALLLVLAGPAAVRAQGFVHPGLLHSQEDLARMKRAIAAKQEPTFGGYEVFRQNEASQAGYKAKGPLATVSRNPTVGAGDYDADANAAHQNALMWCLTGDHAYADKAIALVNAWSNMLTSIGGRDAVLMAGLGPFKMVQAAELLRYSNAGWAAADIQKTEQQFKTVIYPVLREYAPFANGNWEAAALKTVMAIGIFCNDRPMYEDALRYYVNGWGDGRLTHYVINETGQGQESGRDQAHAQLGIGMLAECSEMAWHQGLDLYGYADNRLLKGFEYAAKYNLGNDDVPFVTTLDRTGKYFHQKISTIARGQQRPLYEQVYNHYVHRRGLAAPYTQQAAEKLRPEGPGRPGADHPGFGTFFYTRPAEDPKAAPTAKPLAPGGLVAQGRPAGTALTWVAAVGATSYTVKRSDKPAGPFAALAERVASPTYTDKTAKAGQLYYYTVAASNALGTSPDAYAVASSAGLPAPWKQQDVGLVLVPGSAFYDGQEFRLEGAGTRIDSTSDQFQFAYLPLKGDGVITARFVPQVSSQFSQLGLMLRASLAPDAPHASLLLAPEKTGEIEAPRWVARLVTRDAAGSRTAVRASAAPLAEPQVTFGRLVGYCWLRLERKGNTISGFTSPDGQRWMSVGSFRASLPPQVLVGLPACSRLTTVSTTVRFDKVSATGWKGK